MASDDILQSVLRGINACVFSFGQNRQEKHNTMFGSDESIDSIGLIPLSTFWLFKLIEESKIKYDTKFTVKVSALEIIGKDEKLKDLIENKPIMIKLDENNSKSILDSLSQVKCADAEKALYYLDLALKSRSCKFIKKNKT